MIKPKLEKYRVSRISQENSSESKLEKFGVNHKSPEMISANNKYLYNQKYYGKTLDAWTESAHRYNCLKNGWAYHPLNIGCYGYDTWIVCLGDFFSNYSRNMTCNCIATMMHNSWSKNYIYWRDNQPFLKDKRYMKPVQPLNDTRRNKLAKTSFCKLPNDEIKKNLIIVCFVRENESSLCF
jgi:hypothetical protein